MTAFPGARVSTYGVEIPGVIYGTAWKKERTASLVEQALTLGFRGIDTACQPKHYNEAGAGAGLAAALARGIDRRDLYLQSKFTPLGGQDPENVPYDPAAGLTAQVTQSFARSQANLGTDVLDCLVLHSPLANPAELQEVWQAMEAIFAAGGVRQLGISNCYDPQLFRHLYESARVKPAVLQNRFYAKTNYDRALRDYCGQHGVFYQSFWTLTANPEILSHASVTALSDKYQRTAPQIFFRYLSRIGIIPLTGTTSAAHMRDDLAIFDFDITDEECRSIDRLIV